MNYCCSYQCLHEVDSDVEDHGLSQISMGAVWCCRCSTVFISQGLRIEIEEKRHEFLVLKPRLKAWER